MVCIGRARWRWVSERACISEAVVFESIAEQIDNKPSRGEEMTRLFAVRD